MEPESLNIGYLDPLALESCVHSGESLFKPSCSQPTIHRMETMAGDVGRQRRGGPLHLVRYEKGVNMIPSHVVPRRLQQPCLESFDGSPCLKSTGLRSLSQ